MRRIRGFPAVVALLAGGVVLATAIGAAGVVIRERLRAARPRRLANIPDAADAADAGEWESAWSGRPPGFEPETAPPPIPEPAEGAAAGGVGASLPLTPDAAPSDGAEEEPSDAVPSPPEAVAAPPPALVDPVLSPEPAVAAQPPEPVFTSSTSTGQPRVTADAPPPTAEDQARPADRPASEPDPLDTDEGAADWHYGAELEAEPRRERDPSSWTPVTPRSSASRQSVPRATGDRGAGRRRERGQGEGAGVSDRLRLVLVIVAALIVATLGVLYVVFIAAR